MIDIRNIFKNKKKSLSIFSESTLKTSFYEELQKNEWCNIVDDEPEDLIGLIKIKINKTRKI
ncbi:hypothetical protein [Anaerococcus vaginalis]|uniref:hypothetical protein n=1 Tax=Anaerococcus vaginalis TaxID=33037 RepID=UPI0022DF24A2|nr:hypothetical protein [Anaerococcus vaginalis]